MLDADAGLADHVDESDRELIVGAAGAGNSAGVAAMLDNGFDIETRWLWDATALHHAVWYGRPHTVALLVERGADIESINAYNATPLDAAAWAVNNGPGARADYMGAIAALFDAGADVERVNPFPTGDKELDDLLRAHGRTS